ncbi:hypothetical protein V6N11_024383 [Hibiscus sabdariffa]|uniref:Uncharacterized protein n=2 Tax=Hibiscus sabdariffa TaxID=183260 RepID=A0ABR2AQ64_9ROSI
MTGAAALFHDDLDRVIGGTSKFFSVNSTSITEAVAVQLETMSPIEASPRDIISGDHAATVWPSSSLNH